MNLKFKNDKERISFLTDYRNLDHGWYLWKEDPDLDRKMWRLDLDGVSLIVEEQLHTFTYPNKHEAWTVAHWFIVEDWKGPFQDNVASRTLALAKLKEVEKKS